MHSLIIDEEEIMHFSCSSEKWKFEYGGVEKSKK